MLNSKLEYLDPKIKEQNKKKIENKPQQHAFLWSKILLSILLITIVIVCHNLKEYEKNEPQNQPQPSIGTTRV